MTRFDRGGLPVKKVWPDGRTLLFAADTIDVAGLTFTLPRIDRVTELDGTLVAGFDYLGSSRVERVRLGNGVACTRAFDPAGRVIGIDARASLGPPLVQLHHAWDEVGNRTFEEEMVGGGASAWGYDSHDRLVTSDTSVTSETLGTGPLVTYELDGSTLGVAHARTRLRDVHRNRGHSATGCP